MSPRPLTGCAWSSRTDPVAALLDVTLPVFLVIGFGALAVWRNLLSDEAVSGVMTFTQNFAIPCLLFRAISSLDLGQHFDWLLLISYYSGSVFCFILGIIGALVLFRRPIQDAIAIGFASMFANTVLLGLPVTERAFGSGALGPNFAIIALHVPVCYLIGITAMEIAMKGQWCHCWRRVRCPVNVTQRTDDRHRPWGSRECFGLSYARSPWQCT